jgi:hypothetical protein
MEQVHQKKKQLSSAFDEGKVGPKQMKAAPPFSLTADPIQKKEGGGEPENADADKATAAGFMFRHPWIALAIGAVSSGSTNISTNAVRFSTNDLGLKESKSHEASEVNAFRHVLWQSTIAARYGDDIAKEAGDSHEETLSSISGSNRSTTKFPSEAKADESCDLRNNEIGRAIGKSDDPKKMNVLAVQVLDYFHQCGLWVAEKQADGTWSIFQKTIPDDQYEVAKKRLLQLNENGYDQKQQAVRDKEIEKQRTEATLSFPF